MSFPSSPSTSASLPSLTLRWDMRLGYQQTLSSWPGLPSLFHDLTGRIDSARPQASSPRSLEVVMVVHASRPREGRRAGRVLLAGIRGVCADCSHHTAVLTGRPYSDSFHSPCPPSSSFLCPSPSSPSVRPHPIVRRRLRQGLDASTPSFVSHRQGLRVRSFRGISIS